MGSLSTAGFQQQIAVLNQKLARFSNFVVGKLKNFSHLSIGEQVSYPAIGLGILLILTSFVLFIL
jgi:hypothetical protein